MVANPEALRLLVFDRTCTGSHGLPGLSHAWRAGQHLYRGLRRLDAGFGAASWGEALDWLASHGAPAPLAEIQFWGHGHWGRANIAGEALDVAALSPGHPLQPRLAQVATRMQRKERGLWWFRTCETFGTAAGHQFASAFARFFDCRVAGHTHVIGVWQSGLHSLLPDQTPNWPVTEGVRTTVSSVSSANAVSAAPSRPFAPNTISCLHGRVPAGF
jgi:hypothetical protein